MNVDSEDEDEHIKDRKKSPTKKKFILNPGSRFLEQFYDHIDDEYLNPNSKYFGIRSKKLALSVIKESNLNSFRSSNKWICNFSDELKVQITEKKLNKFKKQSDPTNSTLSTLRGLTYINKYVENNYFKNFDILKNSFQNCVYFNT